QEQRIIARQPEIEQQKTILSHIDSLYRAVQGEAQTSPPSTNPFDGYPDPSAVAETVAPPDAGTPRNKVGPNIPKLDLHAVVRSTGNVMERILSQAPAPATPSVIGPPSMSSAPRLKKAVRKEIDAIAPFCKTIREAPDYNRLIAGINPYLSGKKPAGKKEQDAVRAMLETALEMTEGYLEKGRPTDRVSSSDQSNTIIRLINNKLQLIAALQG